MLVLQLKISFLVQNAFTGKRLLLVYISQVKSADCYKVMFT